MQRYVLTALVLFSLFVSLSCSLNESILSEKDLQAYYKLEITSNKTPLSTAKALTPQSEISFKLAVLPGGPAPSYLKITLTNTEQEQLASFAVTKPGNEISAQGTMLYAAAFPENLPEILIPDSFSDGYYTLNIEVCDNQNAILAKFSQTLLIYTQPIPAFSIGMYPGTIETQDCVLFKLTATPHMPETSWIIWKINDIIIKESTLKNGGDRLVWQTPADEGIYTVSASVFPFTPPVEQTVAPLDEVLLAASSKKPKIRQRIAPQPYYEIKLESGFPVEITSNSIDTGNLMGTAIPEAAGTGFGYILGSSGYIEGNPLAFSSLLKKNSSVSIAIPFSLLKDVKPEGALFAITDPDGNPILSARLIANSLELITTSTLALPMNLASDNFLHIVVTPVENSLAVEAYNNGIVLGNGFIANPFAATESIYKISLAGPNGASAIFYSFALYAEYQSPFLLYYSNKNLKRIITAGQFAADSMQNRITTTGTVTKTAKSLVVQPNSSVTIPLEMLTGSNQLVFEAGLDQGMLTLYTDSKFLFSIDSDGSIKTADPDQSYTIGSVLQEKRILFTLTTASLTVTNPFTAKSFTIGIPQNATFTLSFTASTSPVELFSYALSLDRL